MDGLEPIHEAQERDRKDPFLQRVVGLEPNPDHHRTDDSPAKELTAGRRVRERARARPRPAQNVENPPLEVAPTQTTVCSTAPLCSALRRLVRAVNKKPKKADRDFHAIRRKGPVQGQSRQPLMSWRLRRSQSGHSAPAKSPSLKRLAPIVSDAVGAGNSYPKPKPHR